LLAHIPSRLLSPPESKALAFFVHPAIPALFFYGQ
jgi:hypothetical protein